MYWKLRVEEEDEKNGAAREGATKRFVLHRHKDVGGDHYDLRLEQDGYLMGWRIAGSSLSGEELWATEKAPHPMTWLDEDRDAVREDCGTYVWRERSGAGGTVVLYGRSGTRVVKAVRAPDVLPETVRAIQEVVEETGIDFRSVPSFVRDGLEARRRAVERLCGLASELDGSAFDEAAWRGTLDHLTLGEIHGQLRAYEVRFDKKYPPQPISQPEPLADEGQAERWDEVMEILRG